LSNITSRLRDDRIHEDVKRVLDRLQSIQREVQTDDDRWHLMRLMPYRTTESRIDGVVLTFQDVTAWRQAESKARESEERLRLLVDSATDYAIFTVTESGCISSWNSGAQRMFGFTTEEAIGTGVEVLFTPEDRQAGVHRQELEQARRTGRAADERWHLRKNGTRFFCSGVTTRLGDVGKGFVKVARDLTREQHNADALRAAHDDLERRVRERTSELEAKVREHEAAKL
jgi:two-component system CheB/CheR fusion protein